MELPLFPLSTVLYPGGLLPLHIFEDRYREMFARLILGDRSFGVVALRGGREQYANHHAIGCVARVEEVRPYPDGRLDVIAVGSGRFQVERLMQVEPYVTASVSLLPDEPGETAAARVPAARQLFERYAATLVKVGGEHPQELDIPDDPVEASYMIARGLQVPLAEKQRLLALPTAAERLRSERRILLREAALLEHLHRSDPPPMVGIFSLN